MQKREAVLLVSRAIAALQIIVAFNQIIFVLRLIADLQHAHVISVFAVPTNSGLLRQIYWDLANLGLALLMAWLFWRCGPVIANFLLPASEQAQDSSQPA